MWPRVFRPASANFFFLGFFLQGAPSSFYEGGSWGSLASTFLVNAFHKPCGRGSLDPQAQISSSLVFSCRVPHPRFMRVGPGVPWLQRFSLMPSTNYVAAGL